MKPIRVFDRSKTRQIELHDRVVFSYAVTVHFPQDADLQRVIAFVLNRILPKLRPGYMRDDVDIKYERCSWRDKWGPQDVKWERILEIKVTARDVEIVPAMYPENRG